MTITSAAAASAYAAAGATKSLSIAGAAPGAAASPTNFASLVKEAIGAIAETGKQADAQSMAAVQGKADLVDVVTAVADSEAAVSALVGVRDRVIAAYQQIMAMPI